MLVSLFRKSCRILLKLLRYQQHIMWLFLLVLLSGQQGSDGKPTKWNHSIQRRFMWKQMDSTVNGLVGHVVTGARVMKGMIGGLMPPKQRTPNVMNLLPTETTRIRYIIRNPHTKETKVIQVRPSQKVVKLIAMTPKPLLAEKPIYINEPEYMSHKYKSMHINEPKELTDKLRQLEKEQELIAEGRISDINDTRPINITYNAKKSKDFDDKLRADETVSSRIQKFNDTWKPVYQWFGKPSSFTTSKPYMMSALHTSTVAELLPEPQKHIYMPLTSNDYLEEEPKKSHNYEVTEYTAEESVVQPYTRENHNYQNPSVMKIAQKEGSTNYRSSVTTGIPNIIKQIDYDSPSWVYDSKYRSERGYLPAGESYRFNRETSTATSSTSTTTTTEEPNYPSIFFKKLRNRFFSNYSSNKQQDSKPTEISLESTWFPANASYTSQTTEKHPYHTLIRSPRTKPQKWPPEAEDAYLNLKPSSTHNISSTTERPILVDSTTQSILINNKLRKNVLLKIPHHSFLTRTKNRHDKHRGSVKYANELKVEKH